MTHHYKPFNLEHAKAGAPVGCETERNKIEIFKYTERSIFGSIRYGDEEEVVTSWDINGKNDPCLKSDLVMLPLGYCEGKPVFVGDELIDKEDGHKVAATPLWKNMDGTLWKWPKPEPKYPETRMSLDEIAIKWQEPYGYVGLKKFGNEVIARAIQDGDVFTKAQVTAVIEEMRKICDRQINPYNIREIVDGTDWDSILKAGL